jgi:hypothetical protein
MPRGGSLTLSDVCGPTLMAEHGDAKLTDLLVTLANCEKARSLSVYDRCKAV